MKTARLGLLALALSAAPTPSGTAAAQDGPRRPVLKHFPSVPPPEGQVSILGADAVKEPVLSAPDVWTAGRARVTTPLPDGYPRPTSPGAIELKTYPTLRLAETSGAMFPDLASSIGFWRLFRHIRSRDIAMTAPVEMSYPGLAVDGTDTGGAWSMAFLYRRASLGPVGPAGSVVVRDSVPATFLSAGAIGGYGTDEVRRVLGTLRLALSELGTWKAEGPVRVLHYNGPEVRDGLRWFEVQIAVRPVSAGSPADEKL